MEQEITPKILKELLKKNDMKQKDLEPILHLTNPKISAMMNGHRKISASEQKLLKLFFYGIIPFDMLAPINGYDSQLSFSPEEWRILEIMAKRAGFESATKWIVSQIRAHIAIFESNTIPVVSEADQPRRRIGLPEDDPEDQLDRAGDPESYPDEGKRA